MPKVRMLPEPKRRVRWLTGHREVSVARLAAHLGELARASRKLHVLQELGGGEYVSTPTFRLRTFTSAWTTCKAYPRFGWWREGRRWPP